MATDESRTKKYPGKKVNIPFYDSARGAHVVKLKVKKSIFGASGRHAKNPDDFSAEDNNLLKNKAVNRFITHYFPEFYAYLYDADEFSTYPNANIEVAADLKSDIKSNIEIGRTDLAANPKKVVIVVLLVYDFEQKRKDIIAAHCMPPFRDPNRDRRLSSLDFFHTQQKISEENSEATFAIGTIGQTNASLNDGLQAFNTQMAGIEGQLSLNPNMGMLASTTQSSLSLIITTITKQLKATSPDLRFGQSDSMTMYFGTRETDSGGSAIALVRIDYLVIEESISPRPMKIGYLSNAKYNNTLRDPLTLVTLKNYEAIVDALQAPPSPSQALAGGFGGGGLSGNAAPGGFMDFITNPEVQTALTPHEHGGTASSIFNPASPMERPNDAGNAFINAAKEMFPGIDIENTKELEKGFKTAFSSKELKALKAKIADNPAVFNKVSNEEASKNLQNAIDVTKVIANFAETGPMAFVEKNPVMNNIFKMFGIKELAKEAIICLMQGLNVEIGRLTKAVQGALTKAQASLYEPPDLPRQGGDIRKPYIAPDDFKMFTITGDIWKQVLDVVIDALQQSVLEIIKKLADLLKYNCPLNNPMAEDFGASNITDYLAPELQTPSLTGSGSALDQIAGEQGLSAAELRAYLSNISSILSSMEICQLFTQRAAVGPELLDKILEFNQEYSSTPYFPENVVTYSTILAFFARTSLVVDVTALCNEIANVVYYTNQDNIDLCLTPANLPTLEMEELLDLMENGIDLQLPVFNFDCPDRENFINDPTITVSVPEMFNVLTQLVEMQFVESAESVKTILMEQNFTTDAGGSIMDTLLSAGINYEENGWPPKMDPNFVAQIIKALDAISDFDLSSCDVDVSQIIGFDPAMIAGAAADVTGIVADTMSDPGFVSAIDTIKDKLLGLGGDDPTVTGSVPIFPSYRFNLQFYREFINYIEISQLGYVNESVSLPQYYSSQLINDSRGYISGTIPPNPNTGSIAITDGTYKPVEINFDFPISTPFLFGALGSGSLSAYGTMISPENEPVGVGQIADCLDQTMIDMVLDMGGTVPDGHGCTGTTHGPPDTEHGGTYPVMCTNEKRVYGKLLYNLLMLAPSEVDPTFDSIPSFSFQHPLIFKQIKYASQVIKQVPMQELTPSMLNAVQTYVSSNFDWVGGDAYISALIQNYETENGCVLMQGDMGLKQQAFYNSVMDVNITDLEVERSYLKLIYPREAETNPNIYIDFKSAGDYIPKQRVIQDIAKSFAEQEFETPVAGYENAYVKAFTDTFLGTNISAPAPPISTEDPNSNNLLDSIQGIASTDTDAEGDPTSVALVPAIRSHIEAKHFPIVYGLLVDNMFNYLITNGVFDAATLQSLTLFHLNENCPPAEVKDLLDIEGIMKQVQEEYVQAMCNDKPPLPDRTIVRNVIKYAMHLLMVQMQIAQAFIKNIFVLSAFEIDSLLEDKDTFIFKFLREQITTSYLTFLRNSENMEESTVRTDLVNYFNLKIGREAVVAQGGIRNALGELVFPAGTTFSVSDIGPFPGFDEIIDYLISERLILGGHAVNNAIKAAISGNNPTTLDDALLSSIPTFTVASESRAFLMDKVGTYYGDTETPRIFMTRKYITLPSGLDRARIKMWYYYGGAEPNIVNIFKFNGSIPAFGQPNSSASMLEAIRAGLIQVTAEAPLDCLDQTQINQILSMGGTVPDGHGCPGTTHGPPLEEGAEESNEESDDSESPAQGGSFGGGGFGGFGTA
tara:strand:- start:1444 stop:6636 length:5193 start_codon:yes stop_codon:yes gene_type:complete